MYIYIYIHVYNKKKIVPVVHVLHVVHCFMTSSFVSEVRRAPRSSRGDPQARVGFLELFRKSLELSGALSELHGTLRVDWPSVHIHIYISIYIYRSLSLYIYIYGYMYIYIYVYIYIYN